MSSEYEAKNESLVHGWIRGQTKTRSVEFPIDIINICLLFYMEVYEILKFNDQFIAETGIELSDDNKCVTRVKGSYHRSIMADVEPVFEGIHCWRAQVKNPRTWVMFGIGHKRKTEHGNESYREGIFFHSF